MESPQKVFFKGLRLVFGLGGLFLTLSFCARKDINRRGEIKLRGEKPVTLEGKQKEDLIQEGIASWYGRPYHGKKTSNGEVYNMWAMTAAHKTLPFGTLVRVLDLQTGRSVVVRINDRGPFVRGRIIDLSRKAARDLGIEDEGTSRVALYLAGDIPSEEEGWGTWTVQVGSFQARQRARAMARRMGSFSKQVSVEKTGRFYRVRVGRFDNRSEALRFAQKLASEARIEAWIVNLGVGSGSTNR